MSLVTPCPQRFFYTNILSVKRRSAGQPVTLPDGRTVRFEIATLADADIAAEQLLHGFVNEIGMYRAMGATEDEMRPMFKALMADCISHNGTIIAFIEDDIVALWVTKYFTKEEIPDHFGRRALFGEKPVFEVYQDYGSIVNSQPGPNYKSKLLMTILGSVDEQWGKFMPHDLEKLSIDEGIFVHDTLRGTGIGNKILARSQEIAREKGCNYTGMIALAVASQKLAKKNGYDTCFTLPFNKFRVHGEYPIGPTWDGSTELAAVMKKL